MNVTNWKELPLNGNAWNDLDDKARTQKRVVKLMEEREIESQVTTSIRNSI
jgi:hypothetical protein